MSTTEQDAPDIEEETDDAMIVPDSGPEVSRRDFLGLTVATMAGLAVGMGVGFGLDDDGNILAPPGDAPLEEYPRVRVASVSELQVGQPVEFRYPLDHDLMNSFIVKLGASADGGVGPAADIVAFNYMCTHMGCPLIGLYKSDDHILGPCGCHFTTFDLRRRGLVTLGQATQNLPQIHLEVDGDDIYAAGMSDLVYGFRDNLRDADPVGGA